MDIVPYFGETPIRTTQFSIRVDPEDERRVKHLTERAAEIILVNDSQSFAIAKHTAGQMKALLNEIEDARKACQRPQIALRNAIDELAHNVAEPLEEEQKRVLGLLNGYVARLEAEEKAEARRREEGLRAQMAQQARMLDEAKRAQQAAEEQVRAARDEVEAIRLKAEARARQEAAEDAQLAQEMALEAAKIGQNHAPKAKVPGGRVDHVYEFELVDVGAVVEAGCWSLLSWKLDKLACKDSVRGQLEIAPDIEPSLPGIKITTRINVSVRATV